MSRCKRCHNRCDALPRDKEFGVGRFICPNERCGKVFYRTCKSTDTRYCPRCGRNAGQPYIHPAYGSGEDDNFYIIIWFESARHISTGSTVETWLTQTALNTRPPSPLRPLIPPSPPPPPKASHPAGRRHSIPEPSPYFTRRQFSPPGSTHSIGLTRRSSFHGSTHSVYGHASSYGSHGSGRSVASVGSRGFAR